MTADKDKWLADLLTARPETSATEASRILSIDRSYVYAIARRLGFQRHNGTWIADETAREQGDAMYTWVSEIHDAIVGGKHTPVEQLWQPANGTVRLPVEIRPLTESEAAQISQIIPNLRTGQKIDGMRHIAELIVGAVIHRTMELE